MGIHRILALDELARILERQTQNILLLVARDNVMNILRIQITQLLQRNTRQIANLLKMKHSVNLERIQMSRHLHLFRHDSMLLVIRERIHRTHESRHITPRLPRKIIIHLPEIRTASTPADSLVHIACAAVIRRNRQIPVTENAIRIIHILRCSISSLERIQTLIHIRIDSQTIILRRRIHELPHTLRPGTRNCHRIQR